MKKKKKDEVKKEKKRVKRREEKKELRDYPVWIFFLIVVLIIGIGVGYYLSNQLQEEKIGVIETTTTFNVKGGEGLTASKGKIVTVDYIGKFENGTIFDTSLEEVAKDAGIYIQGRDYEPFTFVVGEGQVIQGFDEAVLGMKVNETKEVEIPPEKGYSIGPLAGKKLIFKIWLRSVKEPEEIGLIVINDPNCKEECDTSRILAITKSLFPGVKISNVDSNSDEGKKLIEDYNITFLPAYLFNENLINAENYERNANAFEKVKDKYILKPEVTGATYYASEEARRRDEERKRREEEMLCKSIEKSDLPKLEAFVVSYCPFGLQMQRVLVPVAKAFENVSRDIIKVKYMGNVVDNKITSMHGNQEAEENLRQICIRDEQKDKFWDYIACFIKEGKVKECLSDAKINESKLSKCMNDSTRGVAYASKDFEAQDRYGVTGSPTLILNGRRVNEFDFGGRSAEAIKKLICCGFNKMPNVCNETLDTRQAARYFSKEYSTEESTSSGGQC